jgi:hypothetical protein
MKNLTIQTYFEGSWHDAAVVELAKPELGHKGASKVSYEDPYFFEFGAIPLA